MLKLELVLLSVICLQAHFLLTSAQQSNYATATFNQSGVSGYISFKQASPTASTTISVSLTGLNNIAGSDTFPWHVHDYPFPYDGNPTPCGGAIVGGHYDPHGAAEAPNYSTICNTGAQQNCEIGDLSGKFGNFQSAETVTATYTDDNLSLSGVYSIIGRSIVIHFENGSRFVCANIADINATSNTSSLLYSSYRDDFIGSIYFRQHSKRISSASVFTNLWRIVGSVNSSGHNWHVHERYLDLEGTNCSLAGPHYNPREVDVSQASGYPTRCRNESDSTQRECEIGDLSNKGAPFDVDNRLTKQFYTDTDLPLFQSSEGYKINGLSTVIHNEGRTAPRIACANITTYQPLQAVSRFNENGVSGSIRFYQHSPFDPTRVFVYLKGLRSMAAGYHIHAYSVGPGSSPARCANKYAGGHWNPHGITDAGTTSDQFEIGDLSGKFGSLAGQNNFYGEYVDPNIPLFGPSSSIGRSIVIHMNDDDGTRWVCNDIQRIARVVQVTTPINSNGLSGSVTFLQQADDPYAETTVVVEIDVQQELPLAANADGMVEYEWSYRQTLNSGSQVSCSSLSNLNLFSSNQQVCSPSQQLACVVGDLSRKHGNLLIPRAAGSVFRAVYTDTNLPLSGRPGLDNVFGSTRTGRLSIAPVTGGDTTNSVCAQSTAATIVDVPPTDPTPTDGAPSMTQASSVIMFSICLVYMASSVLSW